MKHKTNPNILPETTDPIATSKRDSREDAFISNLFLGLTVKDAGMLAGYSDTYSQSTIHYKFNDPTFQAKLRDYAYAHNASSIPKVVNLYNRTIDILAKEVANGDLDNMAKLKHIPTQILQIGKVLSPDIHAQTINLVNIESMQAIITGKLGTMGGSSNKTDDDQ